MSNTKPSIDELLKLKRSGEVKFLSSELKGEDMTIVWSWTKDRSGIAHKTVGRKTEFSRFECAQKAVNHLLEDDELPYAPGSTGLTFQTIVGDST